MTFYTRVICVLSIGLLSVGAACSGRPAPEATAPAPKALAMAHPEASVQPAAVQPAASPHEGGATTDKVTTIAEVWKDRTALAGKTVTVRGKIVKFNGGILGANWMHVQDGSGSAADGSNDLTVTSETDSSQVGDVVTATGTLAINRDLGSGYQYAAIIEHARVAKP